MFSIHKHSAIPRSGFTLLELLMVIAIISTLMSMVFFTMNSLTENAEQEATTATIAKVNRLLEQRMEAFDRAFKGSRREAYIQATVGLLTAIDGRFDHFSQHPEQAPASVKLLARKAAFRFEFPQRMVELILNSGDDTNGNGLPDVVEQKVAVPNARATLVMQNIANNVLPVEPTSVQIQNLVDERWNRHRNAVSAGTDKSESSELLYYTLVVSGTFGSSSVDSDQFSAFEVRDTDEDGLPEFVDAWGEPLRFYRWPTRMIDPNAPSPFAPDFSNPNDVTEVDLSPMDDDGNLLTEEDTDTLREIRPQERLYAGLLIKGLPTVPVPLPGPSGTLTTQRDMLLVDPDDPVGLLYGFIEDPQYKAMGIDLTLEFNEANYHTPDTYHVPLIVSAGPDLNLGLREPNDWNAASGIFGNLAQYEGTTVASPMPTAAVTDELVDNLTNRNRRAGGKR
jgi:prepilin-type N-terminal cleavage/methylation domain-containing protein